MGADHCMKTKLPLTICALAIGILGVGRAQDIKFSVPNTPNGDQTSQAPASSAAVPAAAPAAPTFTEVQECEQLGWIMAKQNGFSDMGFTPDQVDAISKGLAEGLSGHDSPYEPQKIMPGMTAFIQGKQKVLLAKVKQTNLDLDAEFFAKLKENKNVVELPDGLRYEILKPGDGPYPTTSDSVVIQYTGAYLNGQVFDSSVRHGKPLEFPVGQAGMIPGMIEGVQKINKGGKIKIYIPPQLAYGDDGGGRVPPGAVLVFEVDMVDVKPTQATAPEK
jgi:FKBP-type peptidyl-prolyl cis-trans isomerase